MTITALRGTDKNLIKQLNAAGVTLDKRSSGTYDHVKGEDEEYDVEPFMLEFPNNRQSVIMICGDSNPYFYPDKELQQTVIHVKEKARKMTRTFQVYKGTTWDTSDISRRLEEGSWFPITFPFGTVVKFKVDELKEEPKVDGYIDGYMRSSMMEATVTAEVGASEMILLLGWDERAMFVAALPKAVKTVKNAHEILRPKGVPKDALRQGEFFFVPVSQKISDALDKKFCQSNWTECSQLGASENHMAAMHLDYDRKEYAAGMIWDKEKRHDPIWLDGWFEVVHNAELDLPGNLDFLD